jgi:hypothetical protein
MSSRINRREFLGTTGLAAGLTAIKASAVAIIVDPDDPIASAAPARWAAWHFCPPLAECWGGGRGRALHCSRRAGKSSRARQAS